MAPRDGGKSSSRNAEAATGSDSDDSAQTHPSLTDAMPDDLVTPLPENSSDACPASGPDSSSQVESSDESSSVCPEKPPDKHNALKDACLKDTTCLKDSCLKDIRCLKETRKAGGDKDQDHTTTSETADSEPETSDATSGKSNDACTKNQVTRAAQQISDTTTETSSSVADADPSAPSSSGPESCNELKCSGKDDDVSTSASTPGAESDQGEPRKSASGKACGSAWSVSEDHLLVGMKESQDSLSWADIGKALSRHKNDVKARWKAIKDQPRQSSEPGQGTSSEDKASSASEPESRAEPSDKTKEPAGAREETSTEPQGKGKAKTGTRATRWHTGQRNNKVAMENRSARSKAAETKQRDGDILSGEEASSEASSALEDDQDHDDDDGGFYYGWPEQKRHDVRYLHNHIYTELYPSMIEPESDEFFGEHDCAVLAAVDSKYKRSKWLEMQANFYNVTGRMVPLHIIRDKCERAEHESALKFQEARAKRAAAASGSTARGEHVKSWVDGIRPGSLDDAGR